MGSQLRQTQEAIVSLRRAQAEVLATMSQADVVAALVEMGRWWRDSKWLRREAEAMTQPFPYTMTRVSLEALLDSLTPVALWHLIDSEGVREAQGPPLIGHVIAGNTPLLPWVSVIRALLVRSASLVKLPSGDDESAWWWFFSMALASVSKPLARCVRWENWAGGTTELDRALCESVDLVLAYGSDHTIEALRVLCPPGTPLVGYGHRVSFGLVMHGADEEGAACGFATDVLLYDQGGCLSPQTFFVEGDWARAKAFAPRLAAALAAAVPGYPLPKRAPQAAMRVREARLLASMEVGTWLWEDPGLRWTVIARPSPVFTPSPTHGVVSVQPLESVTDLPAALAPVQGCVQGCALAASSTAPCGEGFGGAAYVCLPGRLQAPPLAWPQDGRPVLRTLLPASRAFA